MPALILLTGLAATQDCAAFTSRVAEPLAITATQIPGAAMAGTVVNGLGDRPWVRVGELFYRGYGLAITSSDPRFEAVSTPLDRSARHPCGYSLDWPSGWNAYDVRKTAWTTNFEKAPPEGDPAASMAAKAGAEPLLDGFHVGSTTPVFIDGSMLFLGLMHAEGPSTNTVIVAFSARRGASPAHVLARLPLSFERITALPGLHNDRNIYIDLEGRSGGGALNRVTLQIDAQTQVSLAKSVLTEKVE